MLAEFSVFIAALIFDLQGISCLKFGILRL